MHCESLFVRQTFEVMRVTLNRLKCKTSLGLAMFCLKIFPLESISRPSELTQVHPALVSKADPFFEI